MLTDYYAVWQPTKVNTGASFNLLQSQSFPCWGRLRCTGLLAKAWLPVRLLPVLQPVLSLETGCSPTRLSAVWHERGDRSRPREGTERKTGHTWCPPPAPCLPSILFILWPKDPWASAQQAGLRSASTLRGSKDPAGRAGFAEGQPGHVFLPVLPKVRAVTRGLKRTRAVSSSV